MRFRNLINSVIAFPCRFRGISSGPDREQQGGKQPGMVFQSFNLFSHLTIIENLMLAQTELLKRSREEDGGTVDPGCDLPRGGQGSPRRGRRTFPYTDAARLQHAAMGI